jgi:hypothetical protein
MVKVAVGGEGSLNRAPGIDIKISDLAVESPVGYSDETKVNGACV